MSSTSVAEMERVGDEILDLGSMLDAVSSVRFTPS